MGSKRCSVLGVMMLRYLKSDGDALGQTCHMKAGTSFHMFCMMLTISKPYFQVFVALV